MRTNMILLYWPYRKMINLSTQIKKTHAFINKKRTHPLKNFGLRRFLVQQNRINYCIHLFGISYTIWASNFKNLVLDIFKKWTMIIFTNVILIYCPYKMAEFTRHYQR
jgi:hypothetical protein